MSSALIAPLSSASEYVRHDSLARAEVVCAVPLEAAQALEVSNQAQVPTKSNLAITVVMAQ